MHRLSLIHEDFCSVLFLLEAFSFGYGRITLQKDMEKAGIAIFVVLGYGKLKPSQVVVFSYMFVSILFEFCHAGCAGSFWSTYVITLLQSLYKT